MGSKATNPKDMCGIRKSYQSTIPRPVLHEVGLAMLEGALKYGRHNYRSIGVRSSVYYDACMRHLDAWWEGEDRDPDSGISNLAKAIACLVVLRDSIHQGNMKDDRPLPSNPDWMYYMNLATEKLMDKYNDSSSARDADTSTLPSDEEYLSKP